MSASGPLPKARTTEKDFFEVPTAHNNAFDPTEHETIMPSVEGITSLMPGFVYLFNHTTYSNDYTNRSVASHLGYSPDEIQELGDQMMLHVIDPRDHAAVDAHMGCIEQLRDDEAATLEYRVITKNGDTRWLRSVDAVFDRLPDGSVLRHVGCASDVTIEKQAVLRLSDINAELEEKVRVRTEELSALNDELENRITLRTQELQEAVDELGQLTYIATHDLKVPVNNLCRLSLLLKESQAQMEDVQAEQVEWIKDCADQLSEKIQGLVLVTQLRLSERLPDKPLNLRSAVLKALEGCAPILDESASSVTVDIPDDMQVAFARYELDSILSALMDNAIKYAARGRPLKVMIRATAEEGAPVLVVEDNGTGLDPVHDTKKVFGLFQRAHKYPAGSGISLYCAHRMMNTRGGEISVTGQRGVGAEFKLKFPNREVQL